MQFKTVYDSKTQGKIDDIELKIVCRKAYFFDLALLPNADLEKYERYIKNDATLKLLEKELADILIMATPKYICIAEIDEEKRNLKELYKQNKELDDDE